MGSKDVAEIVELSDPEVTNEDSADISSSGMYIRVFPRAVAGYVFNVFFKLPV